MHKTSKISFATSPLLLMSFVAMGSMPITAQAQGLQAKVIFEQAVELADKSVNVDIKHVTFAVGFKTPEHSHKGPGPRYVLKGKMEVIEGGVTNTFGPGEVFWETGIPMTAENVGGTEAELIIIEILPAS